MPEVSGGLQYWQPASRLSNAPMAKATRPWARPEKETRKAPVILEKEQQEGEGRDWLKEPSVRNNAARRKLHTPLNHVKNVANERACAYRPTADH